MLWETVPTNEFDNIEYRLFLQQWTDDVSDFQEDFGRQTPLQRPASVQLLHLPVRPASTSPRAVSRGVSGPTLHFHHFKYFLEEYSYGQWKEKVEMTTCAEVLIVNKTT